MNRVSSGKLLLLGKVIRPHGLEGLLRIRSYARSEKSFLDAETIYLKSVSGEIRGHKVISVRPHKNVFLMKLEGLASIEQAEKFRGAEILTNEEALACEKDEYFWHELLGLKVYLDSGDFLGTISQIISAGGNEIYVVGEGEKEFFIPATYEVVREINIKAGKMVVSAMEGLLDLNEV